MTDTTTPPADLDHLAAVFAKVRDEVAALHGRPSAQIDWPDFRGDHYLLTAGWFPRDVNHGFKIKYYESYGKSVQRIEIITWAHEGPLGSVTVHLRSTELVETMLRRAIPPALLVPPADREADHA